MGMYSRLQKRAKKSQALLVGIRGIPQILIQVILDLPGLTFPKAKFTAQLISSLLAVLQEPNPADSGAQGISLLHGFCQTPGLT